MGKVKAQKLVNKYIHLVFENNLEGKFKPELQQAGRDMDYLKHAKSNREIEFLIEKYTDRINEFKEIIGNVEEVEQVTLPEESFEDNFDEISEEEIDEDIEEEETMEDAKDLIVEEEVKEAEPVVEETAVEEADDLEFEVDDVDDSLEAQTKAENTKTKTLRTLLYVAGGVVALVTIINVAACAARNKGKENNNNVVVASEENNNTNEVTITTPVTEPVEETEPVVEERDINELIADALANYDGGESTIKKEDYEFMLNYANNNLKEEITADFVVENVINPILITVNNEMMEATNKANGVIDGGYSTGNFKVSDLILKNTISKEKFEDLDAIKDGLKSEDKEVQKQSAELLMYIMYDINNQVTNSKETVVINGNEYNGYTVMGREFGKYYNTEFYEFNDSSDQTIYLTYVAALLPTAQAVLGEKPTIGNQVKLIDENNEVISVQSEETLESLQHDIYNGACEDEYGNFIQNIFSSVVEASIKENNTSLGIEGESIILK